MVGMLAVLVVLGVLATITLTMTGQSTPSATPRGDGSASGVTTTTPRTVVSGASLAAIAACRANFATVATAISNYRAVNGANPPPGSAWSTSTTNNGPFLQSWPNGAPYYTINWDGTSVIVTPHVGTRSVGSSGVPAPATGCYGS